MSALSAIRPSEYSSAVQVWDVNGATVTKRGNGGFVYAGYFLGWTDQTHLYSYDSGISPSKLHRFAVTNNSVTETDETNVSGFGGKFVNYNGTEATQPPAVREVLCGRPSKSAQRLFSPESAYSS